MSLEEQLRNDAQSLREVGWFNRAIMMDSAANEIQKLNERIKRLEEDLMDAKNQYAVLVADVALYEDRGERIKRLEEAGDSLKAAGYFGGFGDAVNKWNKAKEAKP